MDFKTYRIQPWQLAQRQGLDLNVKEKLSDQRSRAFYEHFRGEVYVSFSGGKDSTVLLHKVRQVYPNVLGVFIDTGLEYPSVREFVKTMKNIIIVKPKLSFRDVINKYGYPVVSKENAQKLYEIKNTKSDKLRNKRLHGDDNKNGKLPEKYKYLIDAPFMISSKCCDALKKSPVKKFERETGLHPIVGIMAEDSGMRTTSYLRTGCNTFESKRPMSLPIAFWTDKDIWEYIKKYNLKYADIYNKGYDNTGCMFCMFGVQFEKAPNRFQRMKEIHPKQYNYCINKLGCGEVLDFMGIKY